MIPVKKKVEIDGNNFSNLAEFYDEVERQLTKGLDWKIGRNLDAFVDVLRGGFGVFNDDEPIILTWKKSEKSKKDLGWEETLRYLNKKLTKCHPSNIPLVKEEIEKAEKQQGMTLFDTFIEIIGEASNVELVLT